MSEPTIAAGFAKGFIDFAVSRGAPRNTLLARSKIRPDDLTDQDARLPLQAYTALMKEGVNCCGEPALALQFGEASTMAEMSIIGLIVGSCESTGQALGEINRYAQLMLDEQDNLPRDRLEVVRDQDQTWLVSTSSAYREYAHLVEAAFARMVCGSRRIFPNEPFAKEVHFTHEEPLYRYEYDRIFGMPIYFESSRNALLIHESYLELKFPFSSKYVFGVFSNHADALLTKLEHSTTFRGKVEHALIPILHMGGTNMEKVAKKLGVSRSTLYRRLGVEGVTYEQVLDELRCQMAERYLQEKKVTVNETAYLVGFSDPSAFSRAYKRWTGQRPQTQNAKHETAPQLDESKS